MRHLILPSILFLSACAHDQQSVRIETQVVEKEVMRPCPATKPVRPEPLAKPLPTDAIALAALLGAKLAEWSLPGGYGDQADAIMTRCITPAAG